MSSHHPDREGACQQVSQSQLPPATRLSPLIGGPSESSLMVDHHADYSIAEGLIRRDRSCITIDMLPDETLLDTFDHCVHEEEWETLVHVCRRWRYLVFSSPRRLDLRLVCTEGTPVRDMLYIWPALPIVIREFGRRVKNVDNVIAALENNDRICGIAIRFFTKYVLEEVMEAMKNPFPALTDLDLGSCSGMALREPIPNSLLGGSAPRLRSLCLNIKFPALPKLLLSATSLVRLRLLIGIGHISREAMVECLSSLTGLEELQIDFRSYEPRLDREIRSPPPLSRTMLPVLATLILDGENEYLYHLLNNIEVPLLEYFEIKSFNLDNFDDSQISVFIGRTETFEAFNQAHVHLKFHLDQVNITFSSTGGTGSKMLVLSIDCIFPVWRFGYVTLPGPLSNSECLKVLILEERRHAYPLLGGTGWLPFFRVFTAVENLCVPEGLAVFIPWVLDTPDGKLVLPALQNLFVEGLEPSGPVQEATGKLVASRQLSGHPVAVQRWERGIRW